MVSAESRRRFFALSSGFLTFISSSISDGLGSWRLTMGKVLPSTKGVMGDGNQTRAGVGRGRSAAGSWQVQLCDATVSGSRCATRWMKNEATMEIEQQTTT